MLEDVTEEQLPGFRLGVGILNAPAADAVEAVAFDVFPEGRKAKNSCGTIVVFEQATQPLSPS